jgi:hypothetical protein
MHFDLGKILNEYECEYIVKEFFHFKDTGKINLETDNKFYKNSYGGNTPITWYLLGRFLPLVEDVVGVKVKTANPYIRIYTNGSTLPPHNDRPELDWTISVCIFSNLDNDWPLYVEDTTNENGKVGYPTIQGFAGLVDGKITKHWRDELKCSDKQFAIQLFLHYTELDDCGCDK